MSHFVREHVTRVFKDAGYDLLEIHGDRGGIVQGDGLHLVVSPDITAAAGRYSSDPSVIAEILKDAEASGRLELALYGGSSSVDREGIWLSDEFISFLKEECAEIYHSAQNDVNAIFDAEDAPDREWNGREQAYVGTVDEFAVDDNEGRRMFVRVSRKADQAFNAYESGDEAADRADAASIIEGRSSHGSIDVEIYRVDVGSAIGSSEPFRIVWPEEYDPRDFQSEEASRIISGAALIWPRDEQDAHTLDLAAELAADEDEHAVAAALKARAIERGLAQDVGVDLPATPRV